MVRKLTEKVKVEQKLVEFVKCRPVLYVKSYPGYSDAVIRANSWKKISELIGDDVYAKTGEACEKLWNNVWQQYLAFKRKMKGRTGQAAENKPNFRLEQAMKEFDDKAHQESTYTNDESSGSDDKEDDSLEPPGIQSITSENGVVTVVDFITPEAALPKQIDRPQDSPPSPVSSSSKQRSHEKKRKERDFDEELLNVLKSQTVMDEFEAFSTGIAIKLRKMDAKTASEVQFLIHQVIYNAEKDD